MPLQMLATAGRLDWGGWIRGIFGAFISGGAAAVGAATSTSLVLPAEVNVTQGGLKNLLWIMGVTFLISALVSLAKFLQFNPTPIPETATVSVATTTQPGTQPVTTTTVAVETPVTPGSTPVLPVPQSQRAQELQKKIDAWQTELQRIQKEQKKP